MFRSTGQNHTTYCTVNTCLVFDYSHTLDTALSPWPDSCELLRGLSISQPEAAGRVHLKALSNMHYAFPPRKDSSKPPYALRSRSASSTQRRLQLIGTITAALFTVYLLWSYLLASGSSIRIPAGTPPVVVVTVLDEEHLPPNYIKKIKANREDYALRHGRG